ncbi:MAG: CoA pyrophosphatase [Elusimicrobia bacterium]|nr:CoA pyrophosphatase [Elusimicrobiota bacterium]
MSLKDALSRRLSNRSPAARVVGYTPAAVLVPIIDGAPRLLFIERAAHEQDPHSGQIGFPGGRAEPRDANAAATALREAEEEVGLPSREVQVLGVLDPVLTPSGYDITPVVGWVGRMPELRPDPREVAGCFDVALAELAEPARRFPRGASFEFRAGGKVIWGATARIVDCLLKLV